MPQMMPMNWLFLFSFFSIILIMFNVMNYYSSFKKHPSNKINNYFMMKSIFWKW
uniref:ATP synthase F0 subunit 8 n=1 Tax=Gonypeta brunneri TaxID=2909294 RepID=UPI003003701C